MIRQQTGFERIMMRLTSKRKYICMTCGQPFRALDRRRTPRPAGSPVLDVSQRQRRTPVKAVSEKSALHAVNPEKP